MCSIDNNHISFRDKLLVIDDDKATRLLIKELMRDTGVTIIETGCGAEAIELFKKYCREIFLVILDIRLPVHDGWTLLKEFRQTDPYLPVLVVSAIMPYELAIKCEMEGVLLYMSKPFMIEKLIQMIRLYQDEWAGIFDIEKNSCC
ncbi:MAG: response regulator [Bacteroidota bacterium]